MFGKRFRKGIVYSLILGATAFGGYLARGLTIEKPKIPDLYIKHPSFEATLVLSNKDLIHLYGREDSNILFKAKILDLMGSFMAYQLKVPFSKIDAASVGMKMSLMSRQSENLDQELLPQFGDSTSQEGLESKVKI